MDSRHSTESFGSPKVGAAPLKNLLGGAGVPYMSVRWTLRLAGILE